MDCSVTEGSKTVGRCDHTLECPKKGYCDFNYPHQYIYDESSCECTMKCNSGEEPIDFNSVDPAHRKHTIKMQQNTTTTPRTGSQMVGLTMALRVQLLALWGSPNGSHRPNIVTRSTRAHRGPI